MSWKFGRFHEILFQTDAESFSFLHILKNKKVLFLKKYALGRIQYQNKKSFVYWPNSQRRFWANRPLCDYELKVKVTNFVANGQLNHTIILAIRGHRYVNIRYAHIIMNIFFAIREFRYVITKFAQCPYSFSTS